LLSWREAAKANFSGKLRCGCRSLEVCWSKAGEQPGHCGLGLPLLAESWGTAALPSPHGEGEGRNFLGCHVCVFLCWIQLAAWTKLTGSVL